MFGGTAFGAVAFGAAGQTVFFRSTALSGWDGVFIWTPTSTLTMNGSDEIVEIEDELPSVARIAGVTAGLASFIVADISSPPTQATLDGVTSPLTSAIAATTSIVASISGTMAALTGSLHAIGPELPVASIVTVGLVQPSSQVIVYPVRS